MLPLKIAMAAEGILVLATEGAVAADMPPWLAAGTAAGSSLVLGYLLWWVLTKYIPMRDKTLLEQQSATVTSFTAAQSAFTAVLDRIADRDVTREQTRHTDQQELQGILRELAATTAICKNRQAPPHQLPG